MSLPKVQHHGCSALMRRSSQMPGDSQILSWLSMVWLLFPTCNPFLGNSSFMTRKGASLNSICGVEAFSNAIRMH